MSMKLLILILMFSLFVGCRVSEIREIKIDLHDARVEDPACLSRIKYALTTGKEAKVGIDGVTRFVETPLPGAESISVKPVPGENAIIVTYDAMTAGRKNLEDYLAQNGFNAGDYKAVESERQILPKSWFVATEKE